MATTRPTDATNIAAAATRLPLERKIELLTGATTWALAALPEIGLRPIVLSDGPIGVRGTGEDGLASAQLPAPSATAAAWDENLQRRIGRLLAGEATRKGVDVVLAPVVNLQRTPVGGRHFECLSEDPLLTARLATALVSSLQGAGVAASVKHFVANETETDRTGYVSRVDPRTLREVYLAPFEALVAAGTWTIMAAYNGVSIDGEDATATAHRRLLSGILKDEWDFDGVVVSDWLATRHTAESALAGLDLVMPGPGGPWGEHLVEAVRDGKVDEAVIDDKVARIVRLAARVGAFDLASDSRSIPDPASPAVTAFLCEAAARSTVVLRNEDGLLPLDRHGIRSIALIGHNALDPFVQGGGSASVTPPHVSLPADALRAAFPDAEITIERGGATMLGAPPLGADVVRTPAGEPGILIEERDADGVVLATRALTDAASLWFAIDDDRVASARIVADVVLSQSGTHLLEIAPVGAHRARIDGAEVGASASTAGPEVVLDSSYHNPPAHIVEIDVDEKRTVRIEVDAQIVDAAAYGRFVRAHLRHRAPGRSIDEEIDAAVAAAERSDVAVVVIGTNPETESEGWDRPGLALAGRQDELVRRVTAVNPRTVVVVNAGAPVILPWLDDVPAVLWWWLPGQEAGTSLAAVLTGDIEPSGRLPWTLPARESDVPVPHGIPVDGRIDYTEGLDVGHRGWDRRGLVPAREFGFGLGYAAWRYDGLELEPGGDGSLVAVVTIANTSERDGREVVQLYLSADGSDPRRPVRWLAGFAVVDVTAGQSAVVRVRVERRSFETWSTVPTPSPGTAGAVAGASGHGAPSGAWVLPEGDYGVHIGRSSRDLRLSAVHTARG